MTEFEYQLDNFMLYCSSKNLSKKTLKSYEQTLNLLFLFLERKLKITSPKKVKIYHLRQYIRYLQERGKYSVYSHPEQEAINKPQNRKDFKKPISNTTIANYIRNIKVFFNWLIEEKEIIDNPCSKLEKIKTERKCKRTIEPAELKILFAAFNKTVFSGYRDYIITKLLLDCGCRINECVNIQIQDIDLKYRSILIVNPKNRKQRYVYFSLRLASEIKQWIKYKDRYVESNYLFPTNRGTVLTVGNYEKALKKISLKIGIDIHPHQLRNNFAKYYILGGGDWFTLSRILGHSSVEVTQKAYLDFTDEEVRHQYQQHSPLDNLKI